MSSVNRARIENRLDNGAIVSDSLRLRVCLHSSLQSEVGILDLLPIPRHRRQSVIVVEETSQKPALIHRLPDKTTSLLPREECPPQ